MKVEMKMPDLSTASTTVKVNGWLVRPGQDFKRGQPLLEVETDKATMEVEAYLSGTLLEISAPQGVDVEVGQTIAWVETGDDPGAPAGGTLKPEPAVPPAPPAPARAVEEARPKGMFSRNRQKAAEPLPPAAAPPSLSPTQQVLSPIQQVVGKRMLESKQTIPHFYLQISANAGRMVERRGAAPAEKPVWDAFFACAAGKALKKFERMNTSFVDGHLATHPEDVIGIAVDLDGDLFVIPIQQASARTPEQVSSEIRQWVSRLRSGDPEARKVHATSFTLTNLGATGVEAFTAIINPPEAAILAIGKIMPVVAARDGQVVIEQRVNLTLSVDHRVANGRYAAEFLAEIVRQIESI